MYSGKSQTVVFYSYANNSCRKAAQYSYTKLRQKSHFVEQTLDLMTDAAVEHETFVQRGKHKRRPIASSGIADEEIHYTEKYSMISMDEWPPSDSFSRINYETISSSPNYSQRVIPDMAHISSISNVTPSSDDIPSTQQRPEFERQVIQLLESIKQKQPEVMEFLKVKDHSCVCMNQVSDVTEEMPEMPLKDIDNVINMDIFLQNEKQFTTMCQRLSCIGGKNEVNCTNRILQAIMSDECARKYSWKGSRGNKMAFKELKLSKVIINSVQANHPSMTNDKIEGCIKNWLKHANERLLGRSLKNSFARVPRRK